LARQQTPYIGILGVDFVMAENEQLFAIEFNSFLQSPDCQGILELLNENIYHLFQACVVGSFGDDYEQIDIEDSYAASLVLLSKKKDAIIYGLDNLDEATQVAHFETKKNKYLEYETVGDRTVVVTRTARTLSRAIKTLYDEVSEIKFEGMKYRKDISKI
jgi:phosphoribosylamine-glycine ligase